MKRLLPILLLVLLLLAGCDRPAASGGEQAGTVLLRDNFARRGGTVFFAANDTLYRMGLDGSGREKVADGCSAIADVTNTDVFFLWRGEVTRVGRDGSGRAVLASDAWGLAGCTDTWIYYTDYDETSLMRVSRDGARKERFPGLCAWPVMSDGKSVVIKKSDVLYYLADDGAQPEKLMDGCNAVCRWGDFAYAAKNGGITRIGLLDKSVTEIYEGPAFDLQTDGDRVYFFAVDGNLCSVKTDGSGKAQLTSDGVSSYMRAFGTFGIDQKLFAVAGGWAYYLGKDKRLYRVSGDGKQTKRLTGSTVYPVIVSGGTITYINSQFGSEDTDMIQIHSEDIIRRMNADGSGGRSKDLTGMGLNTSTFLTSGDYLYLDRWTEPEPKAFRIKKDGHGREETDYNESRRLVYESMDGQFGALRVYLKQDASGIFCSKAGGGEFQLCPQFGREFVYEDGWLYFQNNDGIWRVSTDSPGEAQCLVRSSGEVMEFIVSSGKVIYRVAGAKYSIHAVNTDGSGQQQVLASGNVFLIGVQDGWLYYSQSISSKNSYQVELRRIRPDGTGDALVFTGDGKSVDRPTLAGGWIYFGNNKIPGRLRRVNIKTGEVQQVNNHNAMDMQYDGQYVYYIKDYTDGVWRVPVEGFEAECVAADATAYKLYGDWLYCLVEKRVEDVEAVRFR